MEPGEVGGVLEHEELLEPRDVLKILEVKREVSEAESKKQKMMLASRIRESMRVRVALTKIKSRTPGAGVEDEQQNLNQNQKQRLQLGEAWTVRAQDEKEDDVVRDAWQTRSPRLRHAHLVVDLGRGFPCVSIVCFASSWQQRCVLICDVTRVETERLQCGQRNNKCCVRVGDEHTTRRPHSGGGQVHEPASRYFSSATILHDGQGAITCRARTVCACCRRIATTF